jgi:hypothetical protein
VLGGVGGAVPDINRYSFFDATVDFVRMGGGGSSDVLKDKSKTMTAAGIDVPREETKDGAEDSRRKNLSLFPSLPPVTTIEQVATFEVVGAAVFQRVVLAPALVARSLNARAEMRTDTYPPLTPEQESSKTAIANYLEC